MAKIQIKSEKLTPFGGIFSIMEQFDSILSSVIDSTLGLRCKSFGYRYSEIIRSLMSIYFCGGSCIEDVTTHLMNHLSLHPTLRTCSSDTILRANSVMRGRVHAGKNVEGLSCGFDALNTLQKWKYLRCPTQVLSSAIASMFIFLPIFLVKIAMTWRTIWNI